MIIPGVPNIIRPNEKPKPWGRIPDVQQTVRYNAFRMGLPLPILCMPFWEYAGNTVYDLSGNNRNGTHYNGPTWVPQGLSFDGTDDYVRLGPQADFELGTADFTISAIVKRTSVEHFRIVVKVDLGGNNGYYLQLSSTGNILFSSADGGSYKSINYAYGALQDIWYHLAITRQSGLGVLYVNGVAVATGVDLNHDISSGVEIDLAHFHYQPAAPPGTHYYYAGEIAQLLFSNIAFTPTQVATLSADSYGLVRPIPWWEWVAAVEAGYTLTADGGSYGVTGQAVDILKDSLIPIGSGSYGITGQDADLLRDLLISIESGTYGLTGSDVTLVYTPIGAYTLIAGSGTYSLTGSALDLLRGYHLGIEAGTYALSGEDVSLLKDSQLSAQPGSYNISGQVATLLRDSLVNAQVGNYAISGQDTNLLKGFIINAEAGSIALTGQDVAFLKGFVIGLEAGGYDLSGQDVDLIYSGEQLTIGCMTITFDSKQPSITFDSKQPSITFRDRCNNN